MPLTHVYTILCDDVRVELNGKLIVIGVYVSNVVIPVLPMAFPSLSFLTAFKSQEVGRYQMRAQLRHLESGQVLGEIIGMIQLGQPGTGIGVLRFANVIFNQAGRYNMIVTIEQHAEPFVFDFDVILASIQSPMGQPPMGQPPPGQFPR